jgi:predicted transcriptional regulator
LKRPYVKDIIERLPEPKLVYTTVSAIVWILETKDFVTDEVFGKTHQYFPKVSKEYYRWFVTDRLTNSYFDNSVEKMVSFFVKE